MRTASGRGRARCCKAGNVCASHWPSAGVSPVSFSRALTRRSGVALRPPVGWPSSSCPHCSSPSPKGVFAAQLARRGAAHPHRRVRSTTHKRLKPAASSYHSRYGAICTRIVVWTPVCTMACDAETLGLDGWLKQEDKMRPFQIEVALVPAFARTISTSAVELSMWWWMLSAPRRR